MPKYNESSKSICPEYKHESASMIYCRGDDLYDEATIHLAFSTRSNARKHKQQYCKNCYKDCHIYKMLQAKRQQT